jgi:hypothetical protein
MLNEVKIKSFIKKMGVPVKRLKIGACESFLFFEISGVLYYIKLSS